MKTIIKIKTWKCNNCNARQDSENNGICFSCKKKTVSLEQTSKAAVNIGGDEMIDQEITDIEKRKADNKSFPQDPDISTTAKKNAFKKQRKDEIKEEIKRNKLLEF